MKQSLDFRNELRRKIEEKDLLTKTFRRQIEEMQDTLQNQGLATEIGDIKKTLGILDHEDVLSRKGTEKDEFLDGAFEIPPPVRAKPERNNNFTARAEKIIDRKREMIHRQNEQQRYYDTPKYSKKEPVPVFSKKNITGRLNTSTGNIKFANRPNLNLGPNADVRQSQCGNSGPGNSRKNLEPINALQSDRRGDPSKQTTARTNQQSPKKSPRPTPKNESPPKARDRGDDSEANQKSDIENDDYDDNTENNNNAHPLTHEEDSRLEGESYQELQTQKLDQNNEIASPNQDPELDDSEQEGQYSEQEDDSVTDHRNRQNPVDDSQYNTGDSQTNRNPGDPTTTDYGESQAPQVKGGDGGDYTSNENDQSYGQLDSSK